MNCLRYAGLMGIEQFFQEDSPEVAMANRSLNCGDMIDPMIFVRRQACHYFAWGFLDQVICKVHLVPLHRPRSYPNTA